MRNELQSAVDFLTNMLRLKNNKNCNRYNQQLQRFHCILQNMLHSHYQEHWFPEKPNKGSGYRCIRINHKLDPIVSKAGSECGFTEEILRKKLPNELTLWVDPKEVSYRIGENGSICVLYDGNNRPETENIEVISSSLDSLSLSESGDDSGYCTPMSVSPPTPSYHRMSTCKSEFRLSSDFIMENRNNGFIEYVAS